MAGGEDPSSVREKAVFCRCRLRKSPKTLAILLAGRLCNSAREASRRDVSRMAGGLNITKNVPGLI